DDGFDWMVRSYHNDSTVNDTVHKVAFDFVNPTSEVRVRPYQKADYFENHYIPHGMQKYERLPVYGKLLYSEVWNDIDLETCLTGDKELRFTVRPNGKVDEIELDIIGADSTVKQPDGTVHVYFFAGPVELPRARAYQETTPGNLQELTWQPALKLTGNTLSIDSIGAYNTSKDIIIRIGRGGGDIPQADGLCHSTYFGGNSDDYSSASCTDMEGNFISTGRFGNVSFYASYPGLNLFTNLPQGSFNAYQGYILKTNRDFVPEFLTIIHGDWDLYLWGVDVFSDGNICAAGHTSAGNMPLFNEIGASYNETFLGTRDGYITQLNGNDGQLQWSTYFGGDNGPSFIQSDEIFDLGIDSEDNLYICGRVLTESTGFPFTDLDGAYNQDQLDGLSGYIAKFDDGLNLEWCTQVGGNSDDWVISLDISPSNHLAIAGATRSSDVDFDLIAGTNQNLTLEGPNDMFLAEFDENGSFLWGTLEGSVGEELYELPMHTLSFATDNGLYFAYNTTDFMDEDLIDPGGDAFFLDNDAGSGSFSKYPILAKFEPNSYNVEWRTQLNDGAGQNKIQSLVVKENLVTIGGLTNDGNLTLSDETTNLYTADLTPGPFSSQGTDGFFMVFDHNDFSNLYSTYLGGTDNSSSYLSDIVTTIAINEFDEVFLSGITLSAYNSEENEIGFPIFNNNVAGAYYQEVLGGFPTLRSEDIYFTKLCLESTPLNLEDVLADQGDNLIVYPNPVKNGVLFFELTESCAIDQIEVFDSKGSLVYVNLDRPIGKARVPVGAQLTPGVYVLRVTACDVSYSSRFIIIR
ncbi:MAG: T9SS type A sorting domain-containing protein, partial [Cryomorphaceae bacterium]